MTEGTDNLTEYEEIVLLLVFTVIAITIPFLLGLFVIFTC